jgi:hypothetical protein
MTLEEGKGEYPLFLSHLINSYLYDKNAAPTLWWYLLNNKKTLTALFTLKKIKIIIIDIKKIKK